MYERRELSGIVPLTVELKPLHVRYLKLRLIVVSTHWSDWVLTWCLSHGDLPGKVTRSLAGPYCSALAERPKGGLCKEEEQLGKSSLYMHWSSYQKIPKARLSHCQLEAGPKGVRRENFKLKRDKLNGQKNIPTSCRAIFGGWLFWSHFKVAVLESCFCYLLALSQTPLQRLCHEKRQILALSQINGSAATLVWQVQAGSFGDQRRSSLVLC